MGEQTIPDRSNGQVIDESWFDLISQVLSGVIVPRTAGVVGDQAGNLGTSILRWGTLYVQNLALTREIGANSTVITSYPSLPAAYTLTLPEALPASTTAFLRLTSSGQIQDSMTQVGTDQIADAAVTQAKRSALGQQVSSSSGSFSMSSGTYADVTNLSITITTTGRPVMLFLIDDNSSVGNVQATSSNENVGMKLKFLRDSTKISEQAFQDQFGAAGSTNIAIPPGSFKAFDTPSAGTYTYKVQVATTLGSSPTANVNNCKLVGFEL